MPFQIVRTELTKMAVDAIVSAAGPELPEACQTPGGCEAGQAIITCACGLPCQYMIHTVAPVWRGGLFGERRKLASCYRSALALAKERGCETVAFPLLSAGSRGFPGDKALRVAVDAIGAFLLENDMTVFLVIGEQESLALPPALAADIQAYLDSHHIPRRPPQSSRREWNEAPESVCYCDAMPYEAGKDAPQAPMAPAPAPKPRPAKLPPITASAPSEAPSDATAALDELFVDLDESFQQMLLRKIDERGLTDAQCYKKANVDRKLFSKIRKDVHYKPSKPTTIAFAVALELYLRETESLLRKAGYALSFSSKFDVIIRYFIERRIYNIYEINEVLFHYDQSLLGV